MKKILFIFFFISSVGCSPIPKYSDIELTWNKALIYFPENVYDIYNQSLRIEEIEAYKLRPNNKAPLIIYLHGCTGLGENRILKELSKTGFIVVAPDSFARNFRPMQCNPHTKKGGKNLFIYDFRSAELTFALEKISKIPWIDFDNLFIFGVSEGAVTAALFRGRVFNGRIIAQWTCSGAPLVEGIDAPKGEPILSIVREKDPYYAEDNTKSQEGNCGNYMLDRDNSKSIVLKNKKGIDSHNVLLEETSLREIKNFIKDNLK